MPNWIGNLKHLRYIDLSYGGVEKLPETICTLHNLQTLLLSNCYALAQFPINLARLINLHHLDVRSTKVKEMPPHMDMLKDLHTLSDFVVGKQTASDIKELKELQIAGTLSISGLHNIVNSVDAFEANMRDKHLNELALTWGSDTDDLQKDIEAIYISSILYFKDMLGWQEWSHFGNSQEDGAFPHLCQLYLENCPKLTEKLPDYLPSLATLEVRRREQLLGSLPNSQVILETPSNDGLAYALSVLKIKYCRKLSQLNNCYSCDSTKSIPLDYFPRVKELKLYDCLNLESLTYSLVSDSPTFLFLGILKIHKSLPEHMCTRLSSLRAVTLNYYPELESFPEGGLPPNLDMLRIFGCKKLIANRMHWGLDRLISLICFGISFEECEDVVPFPEDSLLPTVLTTLYINNSPNLEILDS
ncbi:disease resistance protein [Pyrus ussuriensis x Pyrus communis]|uniref:Disease resistance protein n=1 Tax=Pyrus ussuriensis x Pyrus communis TaxID=2448454 RepID=A0A5N5HIK1_9ROSA|nr:disease resistance protein [Pyrus ussuriensis x Pyrus communis]